MKGGPDDFGHLGANGNLDQGSESMLEHTAPCSSPHLLSTNGTSTLLRHGRGSRALIHEPISWTPYHAQPVSFKPGPHIKRTLNFLPGYRLCLSHSCTASTWDST